MRHRIAVIPGDGIGKEVVPEGMRVLEAAGRRFIVRENNEGEYSEIGGRLYRGTPNEVAVQVAMFTRPHGRCARRGPGHRACR